MKTWTKEQEEFLKTNWLDMTNSELGKKLNRDHGTVSAKAKKMGLEDKRIVAFSEHKPYKSIEEYELSPETVKEKGGRGKTLEFLNKKNEFNLNDNLLIKAFAKTAKGEPRIIQGEVIQKTESFITLQSEKYKESFSYIDFHTGKVVIL
jgi:hypothetical protein